MNDKIIFIDDQENVRRLFGKRLQRLFGELAEVISLAPKRTLDEMVSTLINTRYVSSYIIDENLTFSGEAQYQGSNLIESIREIDPKIPIYILTSDVSTVDTLSGDIEFVIDKVDMNSPENKEKLLKRFIRHLNTYKDIKNNQALRFDELLIKSLNEALTEEEKNEFNTLNATRSKILIDEGCISENDLLKLKDQNDKLLEIEKKLKDIIDGK